MSDAVKPVLAAFDFDGTISIHDTFLPFLFRACGKMRVAVALARLSGEAVRVGLRRSNRDQFKQRLLMQLLAGDSVARLQQIGAEHAAQVLATQLRPAALARIAWHRERGHQLIMVSASLDFYLEKIAAALGFNQLLCTRVAAIDDRCIGGIIGMNCRGAEKVRQLQFLCGDLTNSVLYAYGDSAGDQELLAAADFPHYRPF
ncbi:HAD-IB family hydrolase [Chromatium okenii]|uniref:HAD-IB family hydrolase n=1 Tax=Chromatium okenii TaxID=61644 RepID=UPI0026EC5AAB|nr:HAD-IB family hydrolase [Chromatium okenii]MBV5307923.1 HAD-IB family hydrolase [Chromatium okenii]